MPLSQIACLGLSHQSAPVELRERVSHALLQEEQLRPVDPAGQFASLSESVLLTTCNRIELYARVGWDVEDARQLLLDYLGAHHTTKELHPYLYFHQGEAAARHLLRVAGGLESQILGEPQILGQVTAAFMQATAARTIGPSLTTLFRGAIRAGKRARAETAISSNPVSIASAAITLAEQLVGPLQQRRALVVGLGHMGRLAVNALRKRGVGHITLANRSATRARQMLRGDHETAVDFAHLHEASAAADLVISATSSPSFVIEAARLEAAMVHRTERELVILDIAMPRDVDPQASLLPGVHLFNIDDLRQSLDEALAARRREIPGVEAVIAQEMERLRREFKELAIAPVIGDLRQKAEAIRRQELQRTLRYLGEDVDPETVRHVYHLSRSLVNKLLHEPTLRLRREASNGHARDYADAVRDLFDLGSDDGETPSD